MRSPNLKSSIVIVVRSRPVARNESAAAPTAATSVWVRFRVHTSGSDVMSNPYHAAGWAMGGGSCAMWGEAFLARGRAGLECRMCRVRAEGLEPIRCGR